MSPSGRHLVPEAEIPPAARESGVCIVLIGNPPNLQIPLIVRGDDDGPHSGQVAFPGGAREDQDTTIEETALRECEEEIGLPRDYHDVVGTLYPLYLDVSNYRVVPVVTRAGNDDVWDALRPQPGEVARIIRADLGALFASRSSSSMHYHGADHSVPCFAVDGETVWGATAMILADLKGPLISSGAL